jgi:dTDP-4-amino-4,6-dideoxygalactose transaminase
MQKRAEPRSSTGKRIFLSPPYVGREERRSVMSAFDSGYIAPCGPQLDAFEKRLAKLSNRKYALAVSSGTAAIDLILEELGVGKGWTVVAPTMAFIATVGPAWHRGAKLAFVDSDATGNMDVLLLDEALAQLKNASQPKHPKPNGANTRFLVIGVDIYGRCCDYDGLAAVCKKHGAEFIVDAAESVGARYKRKGSGSGGLAAIYSFNGNKVVTTSGGGAVVTDSKELADRILKRSQQSREPVLHYEHREVGYNYRMSNVLAAIGLAQLGRLDEILEKRRRIADWYATRYGDRMLPPPKGSNNWLNVMICESEPSRDALIRRLGDANIEARPVWKPMHLQPVFAKVRCFGGEVAETLFRLGVCLPSGTGLTAAELERIAEAIG